MPQFLVRRRSSEALVMRMTGGYVSSRKKKSRTKVVKPMIEARYWVHRQPRYEVTMKPPIKGASRGPVKTAMEKSVTAMPRVLLSNMSEKTAATTASGQAPKKPLKKRQRRMVWMSLPVAQAREKSEKPNMAMTRGSLRPRSSDKGAHRVGPKAKPKT